MDKPLFSIIVPVYNTQLYIEECIKSVLSQDMDDYELILVNDGSTDKSGYICDAYSVRDKRIRTFQKENGGQLQTRLFGLSHARGKYCLYLDSDDYLEPGALKYLRSVFLDHDCDCVIFGFRTVMNNQVCNVYTAKEDRLLTDKHEIYKECLSSNINNSICRKSFRISAYKQDDLSRYYCLRKGEDLLQSLNLLKCCKDVFYTKKVLYNYRINSNSVTHQRKPLAEKVDFTLSEYALDFIIREAHFCEKELDIYRKTRFNESFIPLIKRVALNDAAICEKVKLYRSIRASEYYKRFLAKRLLYSTNGVAELCLLILFRNGFDSVIISALKFAYKMSMKLGAKR